MVTTPRPAADSALFSAVRETFSRMGWGFRRVENREVLEADFEVYHTRTRIHAQVFAPLHAVSIVGTLGHKVPDSRSGVVSEMLMRTNKELTIGNFELDHDSGTVIFRATNIFSPDRVDGNIIASLVHSTLAEVDRLTPFLTLVLRMNADELGALNLKTFLMREDLLPPVPDEDAATP
ncbi:MAG TPA: YbjN domain-containing protein [Verrucomicrobiales bacterium]|nr:YbjN domain-containing protein [Verrucomicrobiales bacterium]